MTLPQINSFESISSSSTFDVNNNSADTIEHITSGNRKRKRQFLEENEENEWSQTLLRNLNMCSSAIHLNQKILDFWKSVNSLITHHCALLSI